MYKVFNGLDLIQLQKTYFYIPTGSASLDDVLEGGVRSSSVTEIFGLSGSGKTQMCFELIFNTISLNREGLTDCSTVYISSKKCFFPERIQQFVNRYNNVKGTDLEPENILEKIMYKQVFDCEELIFTVHYLYTIITANKNHNNIRLIVIDTFSAHLREYHGFEKVRVSYELVSVLEKISQEYNCAIVLTCDMAPRLEKINRRTNERTFSMQSALGDTFAQRVHQRIQLERNNDSIEVIMRKSLIGKCGRATITIDQSNGIVDAPNKLKRKATDDVDLMESNDDADMVDNNVMQ